MRTRPAARLLIGDAHRRILLFRFVHKEGALAGQDDWATPGGGLEGAEQFEDAAIRQLWEETGIRISDPGKVVGVRKVSLQLPDGKWVRAEKRKSKIVEGSNPPQQTRKIRAGVRVFAVNISPTSVPALGLAYGHRCNGTRTLTGLYL